MEERDKVLDAAGRLFYARGFQAVGMDAVRDEAGVSLKRMYQLFPSKEDLVEQVLRRGHERWLGWIASATTAASTPRERLLAIYDILARWFDEDDFRGCLFINSFGELGATTPRIATVVREHKAWFQETVAGLVAKAGGPASLAPQLAILAEGAQTTAAITGSNEAAGQARAAAEVLIENALATSR
jgi:AcrR family transcriptional regulator